MYAYCIYFMYVCICVSTHTHTYTHIHIFFSNLHYFYSHFILRKPRLREAKYLTQDHMGGNCRAKSDTSIYLTQSYCS